MKYVCVGIVFASLVSSAAVSHPHQAADTEAGKPDKVVCKRIVETGSLVRATRTCKTRKEWQIDADAHRQAARDQQLDSLINSQRPN